MLLRKKRYSQNQNSSLRQRLKNMEKIYNPHFIDKYNKLSRTQRIFIQMQLRTAQQAGHVSNNFMLSKIRALNFDRFLNQLDENGESKYNQEATRGYIGSTTVDNQCTMQICQPSNQNCCNMPLVMYLHSLLLFFFFHIWLTESYR